MYFYFLGSHPNLSLAELESSLKFSAGGDSDLKLIDSEIAASKIKIELVELGGTIKIAEQIAKLKADDDLEKELAEIIAQHSPKTEGKLNLGISVYGKKMSPPDITKLAFVLKKNLKPKLNLRIVPNKTQALSSAQLNHIKLGGSGMELNLIFKSESVIISKTIQVQNLKSYTLRDHGRPARDARVGMLPPKLAQIMLNLSLIDSQKSSLTVLDPFCGTGVVLQEAILRGFKAIGSDIEPRMIEMTRQNLDFLNFKFKLNILQTKLNESIFIGDATVKTWPQFDAVVSEVSLGQPLAKLPSRDKLEKIISDVNTITKKFLLNLRGQIDAHVGICLAVPAWRDGSKFIDLPLIDQLKDLGYNRLSLNLVAPEDLIYFRKDSTVARRILLLESKLKEKNTR